MPIDFHYVPLDPEAINGRSFVEQTELAINELGGIIDDNYNELSGRIDQVEITANTALENSNNAIEIATNANNTANEAKEIADGLASDVAEAKENAAEALNTANEAKTAADAANTKSDSALADAGEAKADAAEALDKANTAISTMTYTRYEEHDSGGAPVAINLNQFTTGPQKLYFPNNVTFTNYPESLVSGPVFFDVDVTDDTEHTRQTFNYLPDGEVFVRDVVLTSGTPVFGEWIPLGNVEGDNIARDALTATVVDGQANINNVLGVSHNFFINSTDATGAPAAELFTLESRTDDRLLHTYHRATTASMSVFQRYSTSKPTPTPGTAFFDVELTSGIATADETIVCQSWDTGALTIRSQVGNVLYINETGDGIAMAGQITAWLSSDSGADFKNEGFTLTITPANGTGNDSIQVTVAPDGTSTITSDTATVSGRAYIRYLSSTIETTGDNNQATINIFLNWTDYSGSVTWTNWQPLGGGGSGGGEVPTPPTDNLLYGIRGGNWDQLPIQSGAPTDGGIYGQQNGSWTRVVLNQQYALTEQNTGNTWLGTSVPIYRKVVNIGGLPNNSTLSVPHGITGLSVLVSISCVAYGNNTWTPLPFAMPLVTGQSGISLNIVGNNIVIQTSTSYSNLTNCYCVLEYTRS